MSATQILVQAEPRAMGAKSELTRLRAAGNFPAVIYGEGKEATPVQLEAHTFEMMLRKHTGENLMLDLQVGEEAPRHVLMKEVQHHPMTGTIIHIDFQEVGLNRKVKVHLPLNIIGIPAGVSRTGGTLDIQFRELEVECKASEMLEELDLDVSKLEIGDHLTASQVPLPAGFRLITPKHISVATVLKPRVADADDDAASAATAEPEKIGEKKDEE